MTLEEFATRSAFARPDLRLSEQNARISGRLGFDYDYSKDNPTERLLDPRGHGSDSGKMPWHPTFSNRSVYATKRNPGGRWGRDFQGNTFEPARGQDTDYFREYMREREPNVRIVR